MGMRIAKLFSLFSFLFVLQVLTTTVQAQVTVIPDGPCVPNGSKSCMSLSVSCMGLPARQVDMLYQTVANPIGSVLFTTGGYSSEYYSGGSSNASATVSTMFNAGYNTYEIAWPGNHGIGTLTEGMGYTKTFCGLKEIADFVSSSIAQTVPMCATGNSAGGMQIGYGLTNYNLESVLDFAVLSGGPPTSRLDVACFGSTVPYYAAGMWPMGIPGRSYTDYLMGWENNGGYCETNTYTLAAVAALKDDSLVSPTMSRDLSYTTKVHFVNSTADSINAQNQGKYYYDAITSSKAWYTIRSSQHEVYKTSAGSSKIRQLLLANCK